MAEITGWITVKGNHIPIYDGESKKDATNRFINSKNKGYSGYNSVAALVKNLKGVSQADKEHLLKSGWYQTKTKYFTVSNYPGDYKLVENKITAKHKKQGYIETAFGGKLYLYK